jgi:hypothetical protein
MKDNSDVTIDVTNMNLADIDKLDNAAMKDAIEAVLREDEGHLENTTHSQHNQFPQ